MGSSLCFSVLVHIFLLSCDASKIDANEAVKIFLGRRLGTPRWYYGEKPHSGERPEAVNVVNLVTLGD